MAAIASLNWPNRTCPLRKEIGLHHGLNHIDIVADDLVGRRTRRRLTVVVDRHGPLVNLTHVDIVGAPPHQRLRIQGFLSDDHRIARFTIAGHAVPLQGGRAWDFQHDMPMRPGKSVMPFEVEDAAGNVTHGEIDLQSWSGAASETREGWYRAPFPHPPWRTWPRWAMDMPVSATSVMADMSALPAEAWRIARSQSTPPPTIHVAHVAGPGRGVC